MDCDIRVDNRLLLIRDYDGEWEYLYHYGRLIDEGHHITEQIPRLIIDGKIEDYKKIGVEPSWDCPVCLLPYTEIWQERRELSHMPREMPQDVWDALWEEKYNVR